MYSPSGGTSLVSQQIEAIIRPIQALLYFDEYVGSGFASEFASLSNYTWETIAKVNIENTFIGKKAHQDFYKGIKQQADATFAVLETASERGFSPIITTILINRDVEANDIAAVLKVKKTDLLLSLAPKTLWKESTGRMNISPFNTIKEIMSQLGALLRKLNLHKLIHRAQDAGKPLIGS